MPSPRVGTGRYFALLVLIVLNYHCLLVYELGYIHCCNTGCIKKHNASCCMRNCGKSPILCWILIPLHALFMLGFVAWDAHSLSLEAPRIFNETEWNKFKNHSENDIYVEEAEGYLGDVALMLGDVLLMKHLVGKHVSLRANDGNVSVFLETHQHLIPEDVEHESVPLLGGSERRSSTGGSRDIRHQPSATLHQTVESLHSVQAGESASIVEV
jgi:hypothetical protein